MIANIIDRRADEYRLYLDIVVEPAWNDNSVVGSAQWPMAHFVSSVQMYPCHTLQQVLQKYIDSPYPMTVYLYDLDASG